METMEEEGGEMMVGGVSALTLEWRARRFVPIFKGVFPHKRELALGLREI